MRFYCVTNAGIVNLEVFHIIYLILNIQNISVTPKPTKQNILKHIRYEFRANECISRDILIDAQAAKVLCEKLCLYPTKEGAIVGFI
jgi:hypothetical protein